MLKIFTRNVSLLSIFLGILLQTFPCFLGCCLCLSPFSFKGSFSFYSFIRHASLKQSYMQSVIITISTFLTSQCQFWGGGGGMGGGGWWLTSLYKDEVQNVPSSTLSIII